MRDNLDPRCNALAFGRIGHRCIVLSAGLEILRHRDRTAFDVVVLHELAHVRNRDIDIGFLTIIAWRVAIPLVATTALLTLVQVAGDLGATAISTLFPAAVALQLLVLAATVLLLRNSVLRARELFADARVSQWASPEDVSSMLASYFPNKPRRPRLLWTHPSPARRNEAMLDNRLLTTTTIWVWLAVGLVTEILTWDIAVSHDNPGAMWDYLAAAVFVLVGYAIEISRNRENSARRSRDIWPAIGLGLGVAIGLVLFEPGTVLVVVLTGDAFAVQYLLWIPILCGAAWLAYRWLGVVLAAWSPVLATRRRPWSKGLSWITFGLAIVPILVGLAFLLTLPVQSVVAPLIDVKGVLAALAILVELPLRFVLYPYYYTGPLLLIAAALPLIAERVDRGGQAAPPSPPPPPLPPPRRHRSGLRRGLFTGLWYGLINIPLCLITLTALLSVLPGEFGILAVVYGVTALMEVACAAQLGYRLAHRPHPISAAAIGALTVGFIYIAASISIDAVMSTPVSGTQRAMGDISGLIQAAWYPIPVGVVLGAGVARMAQALRKRRPAVDTAAPVHHTAADPAKPPSTPITSTASTTFVPQAEPRGSRRYLRSGLLYGTISAVATGLVLPCLPIYIGILVGPVMQVVCAVRVVRQQHLRLHPVWAATMASFMTGVIGQIAMLLLVGASVLVADLPLNGGLVVAGALLVGCPLVLGSGLGAAAAAIAYGARRDRSASVK